MSVLWEIRMIIWFGRSERKYFWLKVARKKNYIHCNKTFPRTSSELAFRVSSENIQKKNLSVRICHTSLRDLHTTVQPLFPSRATRSVTAPWGWILRYWKQRLEIWTKNQTSKYEGIRSISSNCMRFNKSDKPTQGKKAKRSENIYWFPNIEVSFILSLLLRVRFFKEGGGVGWGGGEPGEGHCFTAREWEVLSLFIQ